MAIRVALVGTGNCGRLALIQLVEDPRFDLVAVGVSDGREGRARTPASSPAWTR